MRMDRAKLDALMLAARKSAFQGRQVEALAAIDRALADELDLGTRGELLLTRAVALQIDDDPSHSARDALAAVETMRTGTTWGLRAAASAIAAGFVLRTGDLERSVELAVDAMVILAEHDEDPADTDVLRAANALSVLFSRLAAFELAVDSARTAWRAVSAKDSTDVRSIVAYNLCSCGLARLRSVDCDAEEEATLIADIRVAINYLCHEAESQQARLVVGPGMEAEMALLGHADPRAIEAVHSSDVEGLDIPPQVLAWHRLVRSIVARQRGELALAAELLDAALKVLRLPSAEEHNLLRAIKERAEVRKLVGDLDGACEDLAAMVERLHRAQTEQVGRMSVQIRRTAESELARIKVRKEVAKEMSIDEVTGVGTRRWLERRLEELARSETIGVAIMFDLDRFKAVNDTFGHTTGDRVLSRVGSVLKECLRSQDLIARYGGEEFIVFLPDTSLELGQRLAERVTEKLRAIDWTDVTMGMPITISAGVAAGPFRDPMRLVEAADRGLYQAKRDGRDRVVIAID